MLRFARPLENGVFTCHNPIAIKYLTRIRLGFSHLRYHKFKHGFLDAIDPLYSCSTRIENTVHYFLHCPNFSFAQNTFLNEIAIVDRPIIDQDDIKIIQTFLYETSRFEGPIWGTDSHGQCKIVKMEQIKFFLILLFFIITLLSSFFTFVSSVSIFVLVICFSRFCSSIIFIASQVTICMSLVIVVFC